MRFINRKSNIVDGLEQAALLAKKAGRITSRVKKENR
jgi:hypothetical protein